MSQLSPEVFLAVWRAAKAGERPQDDELARMQKFMLMHDDLHGHFDRLLADPSGPWEIGGENLMVHIAMDAATEKSLEQSEPAGIRDVMQGLLDAGVEPGTAFHVLSQAMMHSFLIAAQQGRDMELQEYLDRAVQYSAQARGATSA